MNNPAPRLTARQRRDALGVLVLARAIADRKAQGLPITARQRRTLAAADRWSALLVNPADLADAADLLAPIIREAWKP